MPAYTNAKQVIPQLFQDIMNNHRKQSHLKALAVIPFGPMKELIKDMGNLRRGAELMLRWNTDKGNAAV